MLRTLPADSVHCIVTSPPFWGLRDYGTAEWIGGDAACGHSVRRWDGPKQTQGAQSGHAAKRDRNDREKCECGAVRIDRQYGLEPTIAEYVARMVEVGRELRRVLRPDGTMWWEHGDSYANDGKWGGSSGGKHVMEGQTGGEGYRARRETGLKPKDLTGQPWRVAFALQADGWWLRSANIWHRPNPMPESVTDRTTTAHSYVFMFAKSERYFFDAEAVKEGASGRAPGNVAPHKHDDGTTRNRTKAGLLSVGAASSRNLRSVWTIATEPEREAHFAVMASGVARRCIAAGTSERGCCPACGAPWERVVDVAYENPGNRSTNGRRSLERRHETAGFAVRLEKRTSTTGFRPTCACPPADPTQCIVLDPFSGAGTTAMVADRLGRDAIGIELSAEYIAIAERRIARDRLERGAGTMADVAKALPPTPLEALL